MAIITSQPHYPLYSTVCCHFFCLSRKHEGAPNSFMQLLKKNSLYKRNLLQHLLPNSKSDPSFTIFVFNRSVSICASPQSSEKWEKDPKSILKLLMFGTSDSSLEPFIIYKLDTFNVKTCYIYKESLWLSGQHFSRFLWLHKDRGHLLLRIVFFFFSL